MRDENVVGLGRVVISRRERIIMLEPLGKGLMGTLLRYAYEVRGEDAYFEEIPDLQLAGADDEGHCAHVIIQRKAGHFRPEEFADRYEDAVVELIRKKQAGLPAAAAEQPARANNVVNIMDALRKSIAAVGADAKPSRGAAAAAPAPAMPASKPKAPSKPKSGAPEKAAPAAKARKAK